MHKFLYWFIFSNFLFHFHVLGLKYFYIFSFQKCLFAFYLSLLVFRFLMHMLQFCLLLCSHADHVFNNYCVYKIKTVNTQTVWSEHKRYIRCTNSAHRVLQVVEIEVSQLRATKWFFKVGLIHVVNYTWAMTYCAVT